MNLKRKRGPTDDAWKIRQLDEDDEGDIQVSGSEDMGDQSAESSDMGVDAAEENGVILGGDGAWGGIGNEQGADEHAAGTKPRKPPTGEELRVIKDAADLFKSSSFKLQIDALLPNVRPKASRIPPLERFLFSLHAFIMKIPSASPQHPLEASRRLMKKNVSVPYSLPFPTEETNWKVAFEPPSDIILVGSWQNKISVKAQDGCPFGVDVAVEMPDSLFQEKDYLNGRFFQKRAFYLASIAAAICSSRSGLNVDVFYDSLSDDPRLTKLVLIPKKDGSDLDFSKLNAQVCIIPVLSPTSPILLHRLSPSHANLRVSASSDEKDSTPSPTPIYNNALLLALAPKHQILAVHTAKEGSPAFADAVTLLRVWANQRGYGAGSKLSIWGFETKGPWWSALLQLLIFGEEKVDGVKSSKRKPLGRGLSSYQLFRAALDFLSRHDFEKDPVFLKTKEGKHRFPPAEYQQYHEAVFVDSSSLVNLLAGVPLGLLELLRHDAFKTLEALDQVSFSGDPFTQVFLTDQRDLPTRFDTILRVDLSNLKPRQSDIHGIADCGSATPALLTSISTVLRQGLGDRSKAVAVLHTPSSPRSLSQALPSTSSVIFIGLIHNPSNAFRLVDHGPSADEDPTVVQQFREFWGEKAELRRFKDGRILESVVWEVKTSDERAHIPGMIVQHLLRHHFGRVQEGSKEGSAQTWSGSFDSLLRLPEQISSVYRESGMATGFKAALTAFDELVRKVKGLDSEAIPLAVLTVSPASPQLRYTSVFSPVPLPASLASVFPLTARYLEPIQINLEFEKSSRWPDDLKAIQKMKLAFFEKIATELMGKVEGLRASVVVGDGVSTSDIVDKASLEIVTPEGWAFSMRIWNEREAVLLDRIIEEKTRAVPKIPKDQKREEDQKKARVYREAMEAKEVYTRRFIHGPRHHRAVATLSHQYGAFAGTVRLVKRWLAAHWLLYGHVTEEAVEILCAKFFVGDGREVGLDADSNEGKRDERASVPGSKERGFASVIRFLMEWKWEERLFVPLYGPQTSSAGAESERAAGVAGSKGVWKLSTEVDGEGYMWTQSGPDAVISRRITALAKATWNVLQNLENGRLDVRRIFVHPTDDYDLVIRLDANILPRYFQNVVVEVDRLSRRGKYANATQKEQDTVVRPGFDPARYLFNDLQRIYNHTFKVFHDAFGGDTFGVVWDPSLKEPRPFRVLGQFSSIPVKKENEKPKRKEKDLVTLNKDAILEEIARMGHGIIKEITLHVPTALG